VGSFPIIFAQGLCSVALNRTHHRLRLPSTGQMSWFGGSGKDSEDERNSSSAAWDRTDPFTGKGQVADASDTSNRCVCSDISSKCSTYRDAWVYIPCLTYSPIIAQPHPTIPTPTPAAAALGAPTAPKTAPSAVAT